MTKIIGILKDIGVGIESSRGVGVSPEIWVPKTNVTIDDKVIKARSTDSFGNILAEGAQAIVAKEWAEGDLEFEMRDRSFGYFLYALLGEVSTAGPTDSAYTHTFSLDGDSNQHKSLSIVANETSIGDLIFELAMINTLEMTIVPEDLVRITAGIMAKRSQGASETVSYSAENKFVGRDLTFKLASDTSGLAGASNIPVKSLTLRFEKNTILDHNTGTVQPADILNQSLRISGEVTLDYEGRTYRDLMANGSYRAVRIDLTNTRDTVGGGATNPSFVIDLSRVDFEGWESAFPNDEIANQTFQFTALWDQTNGNIINNCQLVNAEASY